MPICNDSTEDLDKVRFSLESVAQRQFPRILTQFCRDPNHNSYGCVDRNWWHYKIRDFPSIILQQAGLTISVANELSSIESYNLDNLVKSSLLFWNKRVLKFGSFEEYYPWEKGYPPLAFSTLSIMLLLNRINFNKEIILASTEKASRQLLNRFESKAANQQLAGLAALAWINKLYPGLISEKKFRKLAQRSLNLQDEEGWFYEYGGPDLGYLSVTIDCLWDLYDATHDEKYLNAAIKGLKFISSIINWTGGESIGMHNSRNTDYIVPYGISRFLSFEDELSEHSQIIMKKVFNGAEMYDHFFSSIDDRYWCHYIGTSLFRSLEFFPRKQYEIKGNITKKDFEIFKNAGYFWIKRRSTNLLISSNKGGIFSSFGGEKKIYDFGWIIKNQNIQLVNHYWSNDWKRNFQNNKYYFQINIEGNLITHKEIKINPLNHLALRILSFCFGSLIIKFLKSKLIFKKGQNKNFFARNIKIFKDKILIKDEIHIDTFNILMRAPRASKRHVASADNFHKEDFASQHILSEKKSLRNSKKCIETEYYL